MLIDTLAPLFGLRPADLPQPTPGAQPIRAPVAIIAGYCDPAATPEHERALVEAFRGFHGTVISGGTAAGIVGAVGLLQTAYPDAIHTIGYIPSVLPRSVRLEPRYAEQRRSPGVKFSILEPLQYWADLCASGVAAEQIRLLAIGGGRITAAECQMALAMHARVGVVETPGSQAATLLAASESLRNPLLCRLEMEAAQLKAFLE